MTGLIQLADGTEFLYSKTNQSIKEKATNTIFVKWEKGDMLDK